MDNLTHLPVPGTSAPSPFVAPQSMEQNTNVSDYLRVARRRWIFVPLCTIVLAGLALGISLTQHKLYQSTGEILIQSPASATSSTVSSAQFQAIAGILGVGVGSDLATQTELMTTDAAMSQVAHMNHLKDVIPGELKKSFTIEPSKSSSEIADITAVAGTPKLAANLVTSVVHVYNETMSQESSTAVGRMAYATRSEMLAVGKRLEEAELQQSNYSKEVGSIDLSAESSAKVGQLYSLQNDLLATKKDLFVSQSLLSYYENQMKILDPSIIPNVSFQSNPRIDADKAQLEQLEQQRVVLSAQYTPNDDQMISNQKQIDVIKQQMQMERESESKNFAFTLSGSGSQDQAPTGSYVVEGVTKEQNPLREDARSKISQEQANIDADSVLQNTLESAIAAKKQDVAATPEVLRKMADITNNVQVLRSIYTDLQTQDAQLQARLPAEQSYAKFLSYPTVPKKQIAPRPVLYAALAGVLGFFIGCFIAMVVDTGDVRLRDTKDAGFLLGVPVLQSIVASENLALSSTSIRDLEPYRELAYTLSYLGVGRSTRSLLVTSATKEESTATVASNLAIALSKEGRRVVLVDANMRKPLLHIWFGERNNEGLAGLMRNGAQPDHALLPIAGSSCLSLIPGGDAAAEPGSLDTINPDKFELILADLRDKADIVIVNAPAVFAGIETSVIADKVDSILFVSRVASAPRATIRKAFDLLRNCRAQIIGTVIIGARD